MVVGLDTHLSMLPTASAERLGVQSRVTRATEVDGGTLSPQFSPARLMMAIDPRDWALQLAPHLEFGASAS